MTEKKNYTPDQMANAEELAKTLSQMPEEQQRTIVTMANCFIAGYEARTAAEKSTT